MYSKEERKKLVSEFWEMFSMRCEIHPLLKFKKKKWIMHRTKINGVALRFDVGRQNVQVMIELYNRSENKRLQAFEILERYKAIIEEGFENGLNWEFYFIKEESQQEVCRIYTALENVNFYNKNKWPEIFNFFIENMLKLEKNFLSVRDVLQEEMK